MTVADVKALIARCARAEARATAAERERDALAERVFRHGFSDGWTASQTGRHAAPAAVDEAWHFYVADGALQKSVEATDARATALLQYAVHHDDCDGRLGPKHHCRCGLRALQHPSTGAGA